MDIVMCGELYLVTDGTTEVYAANLATAEHLVKERQALCVDEAAWVDAWVDAQETAWTTAAKKAAIEAARKAADEAARRTPCGPTWGATRKAAWNAAWEAEFVLALSGSK